MDFLELIDNPGLLSNLDTAKLQYKSQLNEISALASVSNEEHDKISKALSNFKTGNNPLKRNKFELIASYEKPIINVPHHHTSSSKIEKNEKYKEESIMKVSNIKNNGALAKLNSIEGEIDSLELQEMKRSVDVISYYNYECEINNKTIPCQALTKQLLLQLGIVNLRHYILTNDGVLPVLNALSHDQVTSKVTMIDLSNTFWNKPRLPKAELVVSSLYKVKTLVFIDLSSNGIGSDIGKQILKSISSNKYLQEIKLGDNNLNDDISSSIMSLENNTTLTAIDLSMNKLSFKTCIQLSELFKKTRTIQIVKLSKNLAGDLGVKYIAESLEENNSIKILDLSWNGIRDAGLKHISDCLAINAKVTNLDLSYNHFGPIGAVTLVESLAHYNTSLHSLNVSHNLIMEKGLIHLVACLRPNGSLQELKLSSTGFELSESYCELWQAPFTSENLLYNDLNGHWLKKLNRKRRESMISMSSMSMRQILPSMDNVDVLPERSQSTYKLIIDSIVGKEDNQYVGVMRAFSTSENDTDRETNSTGVNIHLPMGMVPSNVVEGNSLILIISFLSEANDEDVEDDNEERGERIKSEIPKAPPLRNIISIGRNNKVLTDSLDYASQNGLWKEMHYNKEIAMYSSDKYRLRNDFGFKNNAPINRNRNKMSSVGKTVVPLSEDAEKFVNYKLFLKLVQVLNLCSDFVEPPKKSYEKETGEDIEAVFKFLLKYASNNYHGSNSGVHLKKIFKELDQNKDGTLSPEELENGLIRLIESQNKKNASEIVLTKKMIDALLIHFDSNGDGTIEYGEFLFEFFNRRSKRTLFENEYDKYFKLKEKELKKLFRSMDKNKDGTLSRPELVASLQSLGIETDTIVNTLKEFGFDMIGWDADDDNEAQEVRSNLNTFSDCSNDPPPDLQVFTQRCMKIISVEKYIVLAQAIRDSASMEEKETLFGPIIPISVSLLPLDLICEVGTIICLTIQKAFNVTTKLRAQAYACEGNLERLANALRVRNPLYPSGKLDPPILPTDTSEIPKSVVEKKETKKKKKGKKKKGK